MQISRRRFDKGGLGLVCPDFLDAHAALIQSAATGARIVGDGPAVQRPLQDERENLPSIVGLPSALERKLIAPLHEAAAICKSGNREIAEPLFDLFDLFPVVGSGALA